MPQRHDLPYPSAHFESRRRKVLVETPDEAFAWAAERILDEAGYEVAVCYGPGNREECPVVAGAHCALADEANVIFFAHRLSDERAREVLDALRDAYPDTPLCVEIPEPSVPRYAEQLDRCSIVTVPVTRRRLISSIRRADHGAMVREDRTH